MEQTLTRDEKRAARVAAFRAYTGWLEAHPEASVPSFICCSQSVEPEEMAEIARAYGGKWIKGTSEHSFTLTRKWDAPGTTIDHILFAPREKVCERVVVGTEVRVIEEPDPQAVAALPKIKRVETVEQVEWRCPDSLLSPDADTFAEEIELSEFASERQRREQRSRA
jgi:hypothetical protein